MINLTERLGKLIFLGLTTGEDGTGIIEFVTGLHGSLCSKSRHHGTNPSKFGLGDPMGTLSRFVLNRAASNRPV